MQALRLQSVHKLKERTQNDDKKLTRRQRILVATTLFGMFFGAGNLIFPVHLGQMAGSNVIPAIIGFIITAVGIPSLASPPSA